MKKKLDSIIFNNFLQKLCQIFFIWKIGGFSTKAIKKRVFRYIFEQWQERRIPIVHKPNAYGSSAREIGTYPSEYDMQIECPIKIDKTGFAVKDFDDGFQDGFIKAILHAVAESLFKLHIMEEELILFVAIPHFRRHA